MSNLLAEAPQHLQIDDLSVAVRRSPRRQTLGLTIERDGALVATVPADCSAEQIEHFVRGKRVWVYTKLAEKELLGGPLPVTREYVNGEGFYHLGRKYQLRLVAADSQPSPLVLTRGRFCLRRDYVPVAETQFIDWYCVHAQPWIAGRVRQYAGRIGVVPTAVVVRDLGYRWGSCSHNSTLNFHWRTICLPAHIIEYVVVHELVHLREAHHGPAYWQRVAQAMPDYLERERWLLTHGVNF